MSCKHLCNSCTVDNIRSQDFSCPSCPYKLTEAELNYFKSLKLFCVGCEKVFYWIKCFPKRLCEHHLCFECVSLTVNLTCFFNCPPFNITPSKLRKLCEVECKKCKTLYKKETQWMQKSCECLLCYSCQVSSEYEEKLSRCSVCKTEFNEEVQNYLEKINNEKKNMVVIECLICEEMIKIDDIIILRQCDHKFCRQCFNNYARAAVDDISTIDKIQVCPYTLECSALTPTNQLESILDPELFEKVSYFIILNTLKLVKCPKCETQFESSFVRKATCINYRCNYVFCKSCSDDYHEGGDCNEKFLNQRIEEMKEMDGGVTQCPRCRIPYLKDITGCKHVDCINPECRVSFCFECACIRSPLLAHGNHYHRKQCTDYSVYNGDEDEMKKDCTECARLGKLCPRPKNLRVPRLVAPDEKE